MDKEKTVLENQDLLLEVHSHGGELTRIYDKNHDREVLWEGKAEVWGRQKFAQEIDRDTIIREMQISGVLPPL